jgi:hypothetical protein
MNSRRLIAAPEAARKPDAPLHHPAQHNHLVSERSIFGFKPAL